MSETDDTDIDGTSPETRRKPFILVTGTPGVGKTATSSLLAERTGFKHVCIGDIVKENQFYEGRDDQLDSFYLDEDKLLDHLEVMFRDFESDKVGVICDYHACDLFPERWFDLVLVLRTSTHVLYDRLSKRGYSDRKRDENMECEIMQVIADEARESYAPEIVQEVISDTTDDMNSNIERVQAWITQWISERSEDASNDDVTS